MRGTLLERLEKSKLTDEERRFAHAQIEMLKKTGIQSSSQLFEVLQDPKRDMPIRLISCQLLALLRESSAARSLTQALEETDNEGLAWETAKALVQLRAKQAVPTLLKLLELSHPSKRVVAAWALGWLRPSSAVGPLRATAMNRSLEVELRAHAVEALGVMRARKAAPDLVAMLSDESAELRYWAAYSLGQIGDRLAIPELRRLAATDDGVASHGPVRQEALEALDAIRAGGAPS